MSAGKRKISGSITPITGASNSCVSSTDQNSTEKRIRREMEEKDILGPTDQDSTENRTRPEIEEEDTSNSEEETDEDICTEIVPEKEQTVSLPSSYIKSCSQTQIKTSSTLDHTWKINQFMWLCNTVNTMMSPPFPETGQYVIQMELSDRVYCSVSSTDPDTDGQSYSFYDRVRFYILTNNTFNAFCTTTITLSSGQVLSSKSISGPISNNTLLIEFRGDLIPPLLERDMLIIHCKFEFFCNLINKTIRMTSLPSSTEFSKDVTYFENLTFDEFRSKNKTVSEKESVGGK